MPQSVTDAALRTRFARAADFCVRPLDRPGGAVYFLDGLTSASAIAEQILRPLALAPAGELPVWACVARPCPDLDLAEQLLLGGFCLVLLPGHTPLACEVKGGDRRGPAEPQVESTTRGPKDAFTETLRTNTTLLRRHLRSPALCLWQTETGTVCPATVCLLWLRDRADPALVERMQQRLSGLGVEDLLTPAAVEEAVTGPRQTPFPLLQPTERTDRLARGLLRGRVGLLVDGLPVGYLAPVRLGDLMQAAEDEGTDYLSASLIRLLRYGALLLSLLLPALFVAMTTFHQEMLPTQLLRAIIESKRQVPFPAVLEMFGLLLAFELLQEAGMASPKAISQPVSIIGGLVVGTAAVEAGLISPAALIVTAGAGICGYVLPAKSFADALRLWRLGLTAAASIAGLFGLSLGALGLVMHLAELESFGQSYLSPFSDLRTGHSILRPRRSTEGGGP